MQQLSYHLTSSISRDIPAHIIKWGGSQVWLPLFLPYAFVRALLVLGTRQVDVIHIGDPVLAPLGLILRSIGRQPVVVNAHGLDVVHPNRVYQAIVPACLRRLDCVICISEHTRRQCLARGIKAENTRVIPVGVLTERFNLSLTQEEQRLWLDRWDLTSRPQHILLTVGRLVARKGVRFLVSRVLPALATLRDDWMYLVVGDGPERGRIEAAVRNAGLEEKVRILGRVSVEELQATYAVADLFVMPNIPVAGDSEGFGLVTLEARAAGLPVVASSLEGISDSFDSRDDGVLVPPGDAEAYVEAIDTLLQAELTPADRLRRRRQIESRYDWSQIAQEYLAVFRDVQAKYRQERDNRGSDRIRT
jgi:glycosyltransferase involved in cell wall biosynthesis